jgi:hypothetical protein
VIREIRGQQSSPLAALQSEFGCGFAALGLSWLFSKDIDSG